jgi:hypothetical protein
VSDAERIRRLRAGWRKGEPVPPELVKLLAYVYQLASSVIFLQALHCHLNLFSLAMTLLSWFLICFGCLVLIHVVICHWMRQQAKLEKAGTRSIRPPIGTAVELVARGAAHRRHQRVGRTGERPRASLGRGRVCSAVFTVRIGIRTSDGTCTSAWLSVRSVSCSSRSGERQCCRPAAQRSHRTAAAPARGGGKHIHLQEAVISTFAPLTESGRTPNMFEYSTILLPIGTKFT